MADRTFEDSEAKRAAVPLLIGLMGPSGGGKTYSALRLAAGIQRVTDGDVYVIDTESRRALHYADRFRFRHVPFGAPFSPLDYLAAIEHCARKRAGVVIVDSMSHEHEGPGGVLEMHEAEIQRLSGGEAGKAERVKMLAWSKPKQQRRRLINSILQLGMHAIFCFRAKEKLKVVPGRPPAPLGWMPIAGDEFLFEMTVNALLLPGAGGVPAWTVSDDEPGSRAMIKLPEQFRSTLLGAQGPLSEDVGAELAKWAAGGVVSRGAEVLAMIRRAATADELGEAHRVIEEGKDKRTLTPNEYRAAVASLKSRKLEIGRDRERTPPPPDSGEVPASEEP